MHAQLAILTGTRAGEVLAWGQRSIAVGRQSDSDLRFDPERERAVSARHALLFFDGRNWLIRDLGSTNGTLVNGHPIKGDTPLHAGDRIGFGVSGPIAEFRLTPGAPIPLRSPTSSVDGLAQSTGERARIELTRHKQRSRRMAAALVGALAFVILAGVYMTSRERAEFARERAAMRLQIDSIQWAGARARSDLEDQLAGLTLALESSQQQIGTLRQALAGAEQRGAQGEAQTIRRQLEAASSAFQGQQRAAALDFQSIQRRNRPAVAKIYAEFSDGEVVVATAFAVRPNATLLTSRHVLLHPNGGSQPRRIGIQFSDSEQVWPARILSLSRDADLAIVKVDNILGDVPVVGSLNLRSDTVDAGAPVVTIGFPQEASAPRADTSAVVRPLLSPGTLRSSPSGQIEVRGYGAGGASGSPILDANGEVLAVVFGGRSDPDGHTLVAVPAVTAARLLAAIP